jgi:hypothetical protein
VVNDTNATPGKCPHGHVMSEDNIYVTEYGERTCATCRRFIVRQSKQRTIQRRRPKERHPGIIDA